MRLAAAFLCLSLAASPVAATAGGWNPDGWEARRKAPEEGATHPASFMLTSLLAVYRDFVSPVDGAKCPSFPTCSTYAVAAVNKHGPLGGAVLTAARLVSEADEAAFSRWVYIGGEPKVWYPVEESVLLTGRR